MKSIQLLLAVGILVCTSTLAAQKIQFGLQAGPVISQIATPNQPDLDIRTYHPKFGHQAGAFISYETASGWGISLEPGIILKGSEQRVNRVKSFDIRLAYLQTPILLGYQVLPKLRVMAGPELSFLLDATYEDDAGTYDMKAFYDRDVELAALVGLQYRLFEKVELGLRMSHALNYASIIRWTGVTGLGEKKTTEYNQYLQFLLRWNI